MSGFFDAIRGITKSTAASGGNSDSDNVNRGDYVPVGQRLAVSPDAKPTPQRSTIRSKEPRDAYEVAMSGR